MSEKFTGCNVKYKYKGLSVIAKVTSADDTHAGKTLAMDRMTRYLARRRDSAVGLRVEFYSERLDRALCDCLSQKGSCT